MEVQALRTGFLLSSQRCLPALGRNSVERFCTHTYIYKHTHTHTLMNEGILVHMQTLAEWKTHPNAHLHTHTHTHKAGVCCHLLEGYSFHLYCACCDLWLEHSQTKYFCSHTMLNTHTTLNTHTLLHTHNIFITQNHT